MRRHLSAVALGVTPLLAGSINNATRPASETKLAVSTLLGLGALLFVVAEAIAMGSGRSERVLAAVAIAAVGGVVGGALVAFAVVGVMLGASHGDAKVIEGSGSLGLAIIRQWGLFAAGVFVLALVVSARVLVREPPA